MRSDWKGIMKVLEIQHVRAGKVIWERRNLYNTLHVLGEQFFLECLFANNGSMVPAAYYLGLDARPTIAISDTIGGLVNEPTNHGYLRQQLSSATGWTVQAVPDSQGHSIYKAIGNIITFSASGGSWGPVTNLFLTTSSGNSGVLLASTPLSEAVTLNSGDAINMRMSLSLRDYPSS